MALEEITLKIDDLKFLYDRYNERPEVYLPMVRQGDFYKKVYEDIAKNGIINPFLVIQDDGTFKTATGNIRMIAARDLGIEYIRCIIIPEADPKTIKDAKKQFYVPIEPFDHWGS